MTVTGGSEDAPVQFHAIAARAAARHGIVTLDELLASGCSPSSVKRMLRLGRLVLVHERVYRCAGAPVTLPQQLFAACLAAGPGAAASHRAAAALFGLWVPGESPIEITVPRVTSPTLAGVVVHRLTDLEPRWVDVREGVHLTVPARIVVDAGAVMKPWHVSRLLDQVTGRQLASYSQVRAAMEAVARRGRTGVGVVRAVLAERSGEPHSPSVLQARMASVLRADNLPMPEFEYKITDEHGAFVGRVDFAYPDVKYAIEVDGFESHVAPRAFRHDRVRQNDVVDLGWTLHRFTWDMVVRSPRATAERVRRARHRLLGTLRSA